MLSPPSQQQDSPSLERHIIGSTDIQSSKKAYSHIPTDHAAHQTSYMQHLMHQNEEWCLHLHCDSKREEQLLSFRLWQQHVFSTVQMPLSAQESLIKTTFALEVITQKHIQYMCMVCDCVEMAGLEKCSLFDCRQRIRLSMASTLLFLCLNHPHCFNFFERHNAITQFIHLVNKSLPFLYCNLL